MAERAAPAAGASPTRALVIKAKGGLGNRMLSAVTGLVLAELNHRVPFIDWRDGMYLERGVNLYPLLFEGGWMGDVAQFDSAEAVAPRLWSGRMHEHPTTIIHRDFGGKHRDPFLYRRLAIPLDGPDPPEPVAVFWSYLPKLARLARRIAQHPGLAGQSQPEIARAVLARYFVPVPQVLAKLDDGLGDAADCEMIGVHVRFTDRKAPLSRILRAVAKLRAQHPAARLFVATDSAEVEAMLQQRFGPVLRIAKTMAPTGQALHIAADQFPDPLSEARAALADMLALARCDWLVHSSSSTFSVAAALIGQIPPARQIDVDRFNPRVRTKALLQAHA